MASWLDFGNLWDEYNRSVSALVDNAGRLVKPVVNYLGNQAGISDTKWQGAYGQMTTPQGRKLWTEQFTGRDKDYVRELEAKLGRKLTQKELSELGRTYQERTTERAQEAYQKAPGPSYHMGWMPGWSPVKQVGVKGAWQAANPEMWVGTGGAASLGAIPTSVGRRVLGQAPRALEPFAPSAFRASAASLTPDLAAQGTKLAAATRAVPGVRGAVGRGFLQAGESLTGLETLPGRAIGAGANKLKKKPQFPKTNVGGMTTPELKFKGAQTGGDHMRYEPYQPMSPEELARQANRVGEDVGFAKKKISKPTKAQVAEMAEARRAADAEFKQAKAYYEGQGMTPDEVMDELYSEVKRMEQELQASGTAFHGGSKKLYPGSTAEIFAKAEQYKANLDRLFKESIGEVEPTMGSVQTGLPGMERPAQVKMLEEFGQIPESAGYKQPLIAPKTKPQIPKGQAPLEPPKVVEPKYTGVEKQWYDKAKEATKKAGGGDTEAQLLEDAARDRGPQYQKAAADGRKAGKAEALAEFKARQGVVEPKVGGKGNWRQAFEATSDTSRKADILRGVADVSRSKAELDDILLRVKGLPDESNIRWAVEQNPAFKAAIPEPKPVQTPTPETVPTTVKPIEPSGASGGVVEPPKVVAGGEGWTSPMSEQAMTWLKGRIGEWKATSAEVKAGIKEITGAKAQAIKKARAVGGQEGWEKLRLTSKDAQVALSKEPTTRANVDYLRKRVDDFYTKLEVTHPQQDFNWLHANEAIDTFVKNERPFKHQIDALMEAVPEMKPMSVGKAETLPHALVRGAGEATGLMRTMQTIGDMSAALRQGLIVSASHPLQSSKAFVRAAKSLGDVGVAEAAIKQFDTHPLSPIMRAAQSKPDVLRAGTNMLTKSEELYANNLAHSIPVLKTVVKLSERHFTTMLNIQRHDVYFGMLEQWAKRYPTLSETIIKTGQIPEFASEVALKELNQLGEFANIITGRGSLGGLEKHAATLNTVLYASKLMASRLEYVPKGLVYSARNPVLRKEFAREVVALTGLTLGILGAAKAAGASVEVDPRSTDFGKIRVHNTRIDLMGGFQPYIRYTAQIITGERKSASGRVYKSDRTDDFGRFLRSKESPMVGLIHDMWTGETFIGEDADLSKESVARTVWQKFTPLFVQDVYDATKQEGEAGAVLATPGFFGGTVTSYGPESHEVYEYRDKVAQKAYGVDWETLGKTKGKYYQTLLEESDPKLSKIVEKQKQERLKEAGVPKTDWDRWYGSQGRITADVDAAIQAASDALMRGEISPKQFRERVDTINGNARYMRDQMELDPQYKDVLSFLSSPSGKKMSVNDVAYNEYINRVFDSSLNDELGRYDYQGAESRKQEILKKYGPETYQYIQQRLAMGHKDDPPALKQLRQAREILKPYWAIEDQAWAMYPREKQINDQIKILESTDPDAAKAALRRYPRIVTIRKRIAQQKKTMRLRNRQIDEALVWYR